MPKQKKTKFVILGFLLNESLSGYELGSLIRQSTNRFWQESDASIYPTLRLLQAEKLVSSKVTYVGRRKKEIYTITNAGRKAFLEWFKKSPSPDSHREEFLLKFFFSNDQRREPMRRHCERKLWELTEIRQEYKKIEELLKTQLPAKKYWLETLRLGLAHIELDMAWLKKQKGKDNAANHH